MRLGTKVSPGRPDPMQVGAAAGRRVESHLRLLGSGHLLDALTLPAGCGGQQSRCLAGATQAPFLTPTGPNCGVQSFLSVATILGLGGNTASCVYGVRGPGTCLPGQIPNFFEATLHTFILSHALASACFIHGTAAFPVPAGRRVLKNDLSTHCLTKMSCSG